MFKKIKRKLYGYANIDNKIKGIDRTILRESDKQKLLLGRILSENIQTKGVLNSIHDAEFSVFSQCGDDGILQYLAHVINPAKTFVDIGGGTYTEPDTRFLLQNNHWRGLVIDGSPVDNFKKSDIYNAYNIVAKQAFVTEDNVNSLIDFKEIGLLNIDIDGNDYWVWKALNVFPDIVMIEYNSFFGLRPITIPYDKNFVRTKSDFGTTYCGASLVSLCDLATEKGYAFVGCNSHGINAYFVKKEKLGALKALTPEEGFVMAQIGEHRDKNNKSYFMKGQDVVNFFFKNAPFYNTRTQRMEKIVT